MGTIEHSTPAESAQSHEDAMHIAIKNSNWMAVVWYIKDGKTYMRRTTSDFPKEGEADAAALFVRDLIQPDQGIDDISELLPAASFVNEDKEKNGEDAKQIAETIMPPKLPPIYVEEKGTE